MFIDGIKDTKVKYGETLIFTATVTLGSNKNLPIIKWWTDLLTFDALFWKHS